MELVDKLKDRFNEEPDRFKVKSGDEELIQKFLNQYPVSQIREMTLEDYCMGIGSKKMNFCWWLERGLKKAIGGYSPGSSKAHIIFRMKNGTYYKNRKLKDLSDQDALEYHLKITQLLAKVTSLEEAIKYDDDNVIYDELELEHRVTMGDARKLRVFMIYNHNNIVPINSPGHITHFLELFDVGNIPIGPFAKAKKIWDFFQSIKDEMPGITPHGISKLLYDKKLGIRPSKTSPPSIDVKSGEEEGVENDQLNRILYGPPGTGKTYLTVDRSLEIVDPDFYKNNQNNRPALVDRFKELRESQRIGFVTFHQSFSYEEFVEGIKAETDDNENIKYRIEDGIFKIMCEAAASQVTQKDDNTNINIQGKRTWKMSLGNTLGSDATIYDECIEKNYILLGYGDAIDFSNCQSRQQIQENYKNNGYDYKTTDYPLNSVNTFINQMEKGDLVIVSDGNYKFRAIGLITGDYRYLDRDDGLSYTQCRDVKWLRVYQPSKPYEEIMVKAFSQMTVYELKPSILPQDNLIVLLNSNDDWSATWKTGKSIGGYTIEKLTNDVITLRKPNGSTLPFTWDLLRTLVNLVNQNKITIDDIRKKNIFSKVEVNLEKYIVNGYNNIIAPLVEELINIGPYKASQSGKSRVLIIDEINRGNIAKIFGELITLIEPNKRMGADEELSVTLPYSKKRFSVPSNFHIIGTMNTADRSLTSIDAALRRRFVFEEVSPDPAKVSITTEEGIEISSVLTAINNRVEVLLGKEYLIGHSYFMPLKNDPSLDNLARIFENQIIPLLKEYFFDDWEKIHRVFSDNKKEEEYQIIRSRFSDSELTDLLGDWSGPVEKAWEVNQDALSEPESYIKIYS